MGARVDLHVLNGNKIKTFIHKSDFISYHLINNSLDQNLKKRPPLISVEIAADGPRKISSMSLPRLVMNRDHPHLQGKASPGTLPRVDWSVTTLPWPNVAYLVTFQFLVSI